MNTNANLSTTSQWLNLATAQLASAGISTARLDALVLLEDATGKDRSWLLAHPENLLQGDCLQQLNIVIKRRISHEPLAYIRGKSEFYGREFTVSPDTLEPRPETETIIDLLKTHAAPLIKDGPLCIVDVGTGSGCLAITAKLEQPTADVHAVDISEACLKVTRQNIKRLSARVTLHHSDLLTDLPPNIFQSNCIALANLPYVPDNHTINQAAMFEPRLAIFGGADGLDLYRKLFLQIANFSQFDSKKPLLVLTESLPFQHTELAHIAKAAGYSLQTSQDFIQVFEVAS